MKTQLILLAFLPFLLLTCSSNKKEVPISSNVVVETTNEIKAPVQKPVKVEIKYKNEIMEALFFKCRSDENISIGEKDFIKHEQINFDGKNLKYIIVTEPEEEVIKFDRQKSNNTPAVLDTLKYIGTVSVEKLSKEEASDMDTTLMIHFTGDWISNTTSRGPYTREERNVFIDQEFFSITVNVEKPRVYNRDELYLKLRIFELTNADFDGFTKDELAYLRNEVFARYGHVFKTDKMKEYFKTQTWYRPYTDDATDFLNDMERKNVKLIKKLESQL